MGQINGHYACAALRKMAVLTVFFIFSDKEISMGLKIIVHSKEMCHSPSPTDLDPPKVNRAQFAVILCRVS